LLNKLKHINCERRNYYNSIINLTHKIITPLSFPQWILSRYSAPSIAAFGEMGPQGSGMDAARFRGAREGPSKTLVKSEKHRKLAESGPPFLWILSFGGAKESIAAVGPRTDFKQPVAIATP